MELLHVDTIEEAKAKMAAGVANHTPRTRDIAVTEGLGRILTEEIRSPLNIPDFRRSTVDGYAVVGKDTWGADESTPVFLALTDEVQMGGSPQKVLHVGECMYVPTGGMLPEGATAMVMVEFCDTFGADNIAVYRSVADGNHVVEIGEDLEVGEVVLEKGTRLEPGDIAALSAVGVTEVPVYDQPRITIISTGDELVAPGQEKHVGQVYDINTYGLLALAAKHHFIVAETCVLRDDEELLRNKVKQAMAVSDFVIVSGGSSQGKKDVTKKVLDEVSTPGVFTHGLAVKPGKPTILGYDQPSDTVLVGLPGHPVAAILIFELIVLGYCQERFGLQERITVPATMETNIAGAPGKTTCQLVELIAEKNGYLARPIFGKSGLISTFRKADGYILVDRNQEGLAAGESVMVHLL